MSYYDDDVVASGGVAVEREVEEHHDSQLIFPQRLMNILSDDRNHEAICWLPHGRGFIVRNRTLFAEKIMPKFFPRKSKYSSFTRKLNRWNFNRVSSGPEMGAYYHEFFLRQKPHLAAQMFCKNARSKIAMAAPPAPAPPAEEAEPSFPVAEDPMILSNMNMQPPRSEPQALPQPSKSEVQLFDQQQKLLGFDPAQMFLTGQGSVDPQAQVLFEQQLQLMQPQPMSNQLSNANAAMMDSMNINPTPIDIMMKNSQSNRNNGPNHHHTGMIEPIGLDEMNMFGNNNSSNNMNMLPQQQDISMMMNFDFDLSLQQELRAQQQHEARMAQLQQLMAFNFERQQSRKNDKRSNSYRASAA